MIQRYKFGLRSDDDYDFIAYNLICDECGLTINRDENKFGGTFCSFDDAKNYAKNNGWQLRKENDRWINICPECKRAIYNKRRNQ